MTNIIMGAVGVTQPFLLSVTTNMNNGLRVYELTGQIASYTVQASSNLLNWDDLAILSNTNKAVDFIDPASTNYSCRFYRAVAQ